MLRLNGRLLEMCCAALLGLLPLSCARGIDSADQQSETEIYRKSLEDIGTLVVVKGPDRLVSDVPGILPAEVVKEDIRYLFNIRIELRYDSGSTITLATLVKTDLKNQGGFEVLDAVAKNGTFVIVTVGNGSVLVTRIRPTSQPDAASLDRWTGMAALVRVDRGTVDAKLSWNKDGLVEVEVDDLRPGWKQHTRFVQTRGEWKFEKLDSVK